jgi:hypothetical protein
MNAMMPIAVQLIEKTSIFSESWAPAMGPSGADCGDGWQIYHAFRARSPDAPKNVLGETPEKKNPALSRRAEEPKGWPGHAPSGFPGPLPRKGS